jgi:hypothetical protein
MNPDEVKAAIVRLRMVMSVTEPGIGVAMGHELFMACSKAGLITMEEFNVPGKGSLPHKLPAFGRRHLVFVHPELPEWEYRVGEPENA